MALTFTLPNDSRITGGGFTMQAASVAFDSAYVTGGEPVSTTDFAMAKIMCLTIDAASGYSFSWDKEAGTVQVFQIASMANPSSAGNLIGGLSECSTLENLSSLTGVKVYAWGW